MTFDNLRFEIFRVPMQHCQVEGFSLPFAVTLDKLVQRMAHKCQNTLVSDNLDAPDILK